MSEEFAAYWLFPTLGAAVAAVMFGIAYVIGGAAKLGGPEDPREPRILTEEEVARFKGDAPCMK